MEHNNTTCLSRLVFFFRSSLLHFPQSPKKAQALAPTEREPRAGRGVFKLVFRENAGTIFFVDQRCADLCREGGVRERVFRTRAVRKFKVNMVDHFFWTLGLPGILCVCVQKVNVKKCIFYKDYKKCGQNMRISSPAESSLGAYAEDSSDADRCFFGAL